MSREIKFRIWSYEDKQYRTDCNLTRIFNSMTGTPATVYSDEGDRFDIEQYTGLKDNIGKEIYEGDIVKVYSRRKLLDGFYQVIWNNEAGGFECECLKPMVKGQDNIKDVRVFNEYYSKFRVFGNIHENPELLDEDINVLNKEGEK